MARTTTIVTSVTPSRSSSTIGASSGGTLPGSAGRPLAGAPWRARPRAQPAATSVGPLCVLQEGGCCLAFRGTSEVDPDELDDIDRAYVERFRDPPDAPDYCTTCRAGRSPTARPARSGSTSGSARPVAESAR
jgi:hypothetical protein